jgi:hypothetical protein
MIAIRLVKLLYTIAIELGRECTHCLCTLPERILRVFAVNTLLIKFFGGGFELVQHLKHIFINNFAGFY